MALLLLGTGGCTAITDLPALNPPVSPLVYEPVAAWWYYYPDLSDSEWDYHTQVRKGTDPILVQLRPSEHPEYYRVRQTNESAVHAYNQRRLSQQGRGMMAPPQGTERGIQTPRVHASAIALPGGTALHRQTPLSTSKRVTVPGMDAPLPVEIPLVRSEGKSASKGAAPRFSIRMGQFQSPNEAEDVKQRLWALGFNSFQHTDSQTGKPPMIVVNAGPYGDRKEAEEAMTRLKAEIRRVEGTDSFPVEVVPYTQ